MTPRGEFFDYDPFTGLTEYYEETGDGKIHIHTYQDVEPILEWSKYICNTGTADEAFTKQGVAVYAYMPAIILAQMLKRGINYLDQNDIGRVVHEMNTTYSHFKTTSKHHEVK